MQYKRLGKTGLNISVLCLGTMQWGWTADEVNAQKIMDKYVFAGGNYLDTADIYPGWVNEKSVGLSEKIIGRWIKKRRKRNDLIIATKVGGPVWEGPFGKGLNKKHIIQAVEKSLKRLQVDYIDLYQAHIPDNDVPIEETLSAFNMLIDQGKVLYIGATNYRAWQLMEAISVGDHMGYERYQSIQTHYNLVHRIDFERDLKMLCEKKGVGVFAYSPLGGGFLTGKYNKDTVLLNSKRLEHVEKQYIHDERAWKILSKVKEIAIENHKTPLQVALNWMLSQSIITASVFGSNSLAQLNEILASVDFCLSEEDLNRLDIVSGGPFDWQEFIT